MAKLSGANKNCQPAFLSTHSAASAARVPVDGSVSDSGSVATPPATDDSIRADDAKARLEFPVGWVLTHEKPSASEACLFAALAADLRDVCCLAGTKTSQTIVCATIITQLEYTAAVAFKPRATGKQRKPIERTNSRSGCA